MATYSPEPLEHQCVVLIEPHNVQVFTDIQVKGTASFSLQCQIKWKFGWGLQGKVEFVLVSGPVNVARHTKSFLARQFVYSFSTPHFLIAHFNSTPQQRRPDLSESYQEYRIQCL